MPNVGRPSKGCENCRSRKVKCDQKRPSCSQCIRAGKSCHGYRDPLSMMFKNESAVVAKKAERRYEVLAKQKNPQSSKKREPATPESDSSETWDFNRDSPSSSASMQIVPHSRYPTPESMTREIVPCIEDQALGFFVGNYVVQPAVVPRGQFEWVTELLSQPDVEEILRLSVNATSLAGLANATKSPTIMQQAQAAYGSALRITNNALRVKETAIKDSTLISVIMLGLYENFVFQDRGSIQSWAKHVDGACTLLKLRGDEQFKGSLGRRLFHQFYGIILLVALETGKPVHEGMHELYKAMALTSDYSVHGRQWTTQMIDVMHRSINLNQDKHTDPKTMVATALDLDHELDEIKQLMPRIWNYEVIQLERPSEYHFGSTYHIYLDPWISQMWNNFRSCRLGLYTIIRENLIKGWMQYNPPLFSQEEYHSTKVIAEREITYIISDVVAAVPQIIGMIPFPDPETAKRRAYDANVTEPSPVYKFHPPGTFLDSAHCTHMVHIIWPLYAANKVDLATPEMRQWAIDILHYVALRIGNKQAVVLADELKEIQRTVSFTRPFADHTTLSFSSND